MKRSNEIGITLIALIITIIVLLILAGITMNLIIGERGIIIRAGEAGRNYEEAAKREDRELENYFDDIEEIVNGIPKEQNIEIALTGEKLQTSLPINLEATITDRRKRSE